MQPATSTSASTSPSDRVDYRGGMSLDFAAMLVALVTVAGALVVVVMQAVRYFRQDRDERGDDGTGAP